MRRFDGVTFIYWLVMLSLALCAGSDGQCGMQDLGTLGGSYSCAFAVNNSGQIVGYSETASGEYHAFIWQNGVMRDLGTLGGSGSEAWGINNAGQVVGVYYQSGYHRAFAWDNGIMRDLGTLGGNFSQANGINNNGLIVGAATTEGDIFHAVIWRDGIVQVPGLPAGIGGNGINDHGQIVGVYPTSSGWRPFIWSNGTTQLLGTLGGSWSYASRINNAGQVIGRSEMSPDTNGAFLWSDGVMQYLGGGDIEPTGINNNGVIVGWNYSTSRAIVWINGVITDPGTLGGGWAYAQGINDSGQIVGVSQRADGAHHAFLYTPVPIPGALWLLGSGLLGLAGIRRRHKK
jgi:probable HAF family extracellular repeat protein